MRKERRQFVKGKESHDVNHILQDSRADPLWDYPSTTGARSAHLGQRVSGLLWGVAFRALEGHEPIFEPHDIPLPAIRESDLGKRKEVVLRVRDQLRGVFVSMEPKRDPGYLAGDLRSKTRPGFETLRLRKRAVDDIGVQKVAVFRLPSVSFVSMTDNSEIWLATAVSIARSRAF